MAYPVSGRRRTKLKVDQELELVPFIDVMAVLLTFLLMTAVILQTAIIEINLPSAAGTGTTDMTQEEKKQQLNLTIIITDQGFIVGGSGAILPPIPKQGGEYDWEGLKEQLMRIKEQFPGQSSVIIAAEQQIIYDDIIKAMDACLASGLPEIALAPKIA
jgi:biopolymer transport protein ExbD